MGNTDKDKKNNNLKKSLCMCAGFFAGRALGYIIGRIAGSPQLYTALGGMIGLAIVADILFKK